MRSASADNGRESLVAIAGNSSVAPNPAKSASEIRRRATERIWALDFARALQQRRTEPGEERERNPAPIFAQLRGAGEARGTDSGHQRKGSREAEKHRQTTRGKRSIGACKHERHDRQDAGAQDRERAAQKCNDDK